MKGRRISRKAKVILLVIAAAIIVIGGLQIAWWNTMNKLSRASPAMFLGEIEAATRDSLVSPTDVDLLRQLQAISASRECTMLGRSLCVGVGTAPLFRGSITDDDRRNMVLVRDLLLPTHGKLSYKELSDFWIANPQIKQVFRTYHAAVKEYMRRRKLAEHAALSQAAVIG